MAVFFNSAFRSELSNTVDNGTIDRAVVEAANAIKKVLKAENPDMCTCEVCKYIAERVSTYFEKQPIA